MVWTLASCVKVPSESVTRLVFVVPLGGALTLTILAVVRKASRAGGSIVAAVRVADAGATAAVVGPCAAEFAWSRRPAANAERETTTRGYDRRGRAIVFSSRAMRDRIRAGFYRRPPAP